jgi:hypothetical protein
VKFREIERQRLVQLRNDLFNDPGNGLFFGKEREFVLTDPGLNLWEGIREDAKDYFNRYKIQWWKGNNEGPTGHLLSSQVACINYLYALRQRQDLATLLLQSINPSVVSAVIVDDGYVEFEFIGQQQYLKEKGFTRGANCTSVDAAMIGELSDGERCIFLIEWKYTESYDNADLYVKERAMVYDELITAPDSPFVEKAPEVYYFEPFYQLMRQTLLGSLLAANRDHGCSQYHHIHVVPSGNKELLDNVTSPVLRSKYGQNISTVWRSVLASPGRFTSISPEKLISSLIQGKDSRSLLTYLKKRYS